jgi:hypothetical protein
MLRCESEWFVYRDRDSIHGPHAFLTWVIFLVSVFGQLYRLEPLAEEQKARWRREMGWILSVSDYIVDFVPSVQHMPDGTITEVRASKSGLYGVT